MQIGFFAIGIGPSADPELLARAARAVEQCGFYSLWTGEHVVLVSQYGSKYPYAQDGKMPLPSYKVDFLDPFATLTFAAAHTKKIRLGTGICLVPEHNPVVLAKQVASLDKLSGGRFDFGVGIGWLAEEFAAVGVPWERRADRTREYLKAMKLLWTEDEPEFRGEFCAFPKVCSYPKPIQKPYPPIIFGGESGPALKRVGEVGDGWFGVNVSPDLTKTMIERMRNHAKAAGRDPAKLHFSVSAGIGAPIGLDDVKLYRDAGVDQMIVGSIPRDLKTVQAEVEQLAEKIVIPAAKF